MHFKLFKISILSLFMTSFCAYSALNTDFLRGGMQSQAIDIFDESVKYPAGHYIVEVVFNRRSLGRKELIIQSSDKETLCLNTEWMNELHLPINYKEFGNYFDPLRNCYNIGNYPGSKVIFNNAKQILTFSVPQIALDESNQQQSWDYGIPGAKLNYSGYVSKTSSAQTQVYGDIDSYINMGRWVTYVRSNYSKDSSFDTSEATVSTAIRPIQGNFVAGKTLTSTTTLPNFMFYGIALRSESSMRPWEMRGYAPVISGVVNSNAKITISQNGYILSSQVVPAGAYQLNNISPVSNGDLTVTVEEDNGTKSVRRYPVATLPSLLRANELNYNFVVGKREIDGKRENSLFQLGAVDYGFKSVTAHSAWILHQNYQSAALGISKDLGQFGAISFHTNYAISKFQKQTSTSSNFKQSGISHVAQYANSLTDNTNLQLLAYRYTGKDYVDFADFNPNALYYRSNRKERYETILSQNFDSSFVNLSTWIQTYRNHVKNEMGASLSYNTALKGMDLSISGDYQKLNDYHKDNYMISIGLNIPFSIFDKNNFWTNSVNYNRMNKASFNSGVSGNINDHLNYSVNTNKDKDDWSNSAYLGINQDLINTGFAISQGQHQTSGSMNASGSILVTKETGLLLSSVRRDTVAIANIGNLENIKFNDSPPTNSRGNTIMGISPYMVNNLKIDTEEVPDNIELLDTVYSFVPTDKAIVYREFKYSTIHRFILRLKKANGEFVPAGSSARTDKNAYVGFVSNGGVLLLNLLSKLEKITVTSPNGEQCILNISNVKSNENKMMEIKCNE
ncbi:PefC/AfrB family outer membrane usher protein [Pragia fontium]|uniref:Outer membrane usher protein FimD/PapC n=2 Tax=Pragia fontium TaxID=82985 RepID=A0AAJ5BI52_9GAMM|nr:PefC/AfrB family outer membrane usher protein [Pragia fontium]SFD21756.1 Outer membrane usher protein FimD/PapC [Pragia fontium DSM 5563 = ATCC 49100]VEJ56966.1 F1 capsule-anchoring protein precursor [Pragia fontium]